ncbi:MAG: type 1 glutamine amidotransferase domain-containing protein [Pacificimonas sp.]
MSNVLIITMSGFEKSELFDPKANLEAAGHNVTVASKETGEVKSMDGLDWSDPVEATVTFENANPNDYDGLLIPGGIPNPDQMRQEDRAIHIIRTMNDARKPIAAICHAPWMLAEAGIVDGRTVTSYPSIRTDLKNAGANVVDQEVATDGNLITSRNPDDIQAFSKALIAALA